MKTSFEAEQGAATDGSVGDAVDSAAEAAKGLGGRVGKAGERLADAAAAAKSRLSDSEAMSNLKDQAAQAAQQAKHAVAAMADEARGRIAEIIDQQKHAGADQVAGVAKAAQAAAGDLQQTSPQLAKLVRSAAESVDHVAEDIRSSDIADILASLSAYGRNRPLAFFGGAVVAGFLLSRFLKSESPDGFGAGPRRA